MTIKINLYSLGGQITPAETDIFQRAARNLECAVNHPDFIPRVRAADFREALFRPAPNLPRVTKTPEEVVEIIVTGLERNTPADAELDMAVVIDGSIDSPTLGSTTPGRLPWRTAKWFAERSARAADTVTPARHLIHEWLHVAGFVHVRNNGPRKDVPYMVGDIVRATLIEQTVEKAADDIHEDETLRWDFERANEETED